MEGSFGWMGNYTLEGKITLDYKFCLNFIKVKKLQICIFEGLGENDVYVIYCFIACGYYTLLFN